MRPCDLVLVGIGGQGVLTIGELLLRAAFAAEIPASLCPTKGMAQRGGSVKVEVRLGRERIGPRIREGGADLVVGMERSEALRGIRYGKPEGTFLLYDHVWEPTGVMLGREPYPSREDVIRALIARRIEVRLLDPADRPSIDGRPVASNIYVLGALLTWAPLAELLDIEAVEEVVAAQWPKAQGLNRTAFRSGQKAMR